jgi:hypothetical protein
MALNIIIDKSTFQLLSYNELLRLTYYYKNNITPILVMEILGDLKKEAKDGSPPPQNRVIDFATKLFPTSTIVNEHYAKALTAELSLERPIEMDGRPMVNIGKSVQTKDGAKGWVVGQTDEERAIYQWREGKFTEADRALSELWRNTTTQEDILINLKKELQEKGNNIKLKSFDELATFVAGHIDDPNNQQLLLTDLCRSSKINVLRAMLILKKWQAAGKPLLKNFMPYAYHILKVNTLFHVGLQSGLISTRPTNKVDLEYLYYLPFCNIFTSNDNLHLNLVPLLLRNDQVFIKGTDLKADLSSINEKLANLGDEDREVYKKKPPVDANSFTFKMYKKFFDYPDGFQWKLSSKPLEKEEAIRKMEEFLSATEGDEIGLRHGDDGEFVIRKSYISQKDPCPCGSGKIVIECCMTKQQFDDAARTQAKKRDDN